MALQAFSPGISIKNEDLDALKQENAELKAKLESLQRLAAVGAQFGSVSSSASIKKEHVTPRRERTSFSMQSPPPLTAPSPQPQQGSPLVMHSSPNVNDASSPSSNKMAYVRNKLVACPDSDPVAFQLAQIVNQEVDALTGSNGDDLSDGGGFDHSHHYKKRKSYAYANLFFFFSPLWRHCLTLTINCSDNDFEAAKQDYFSSRRNSSFDILQQTQEHQQRLQVTEAGLSEASLLQNFVRRASLPSAFFDGAPPPALMQNSAHSDGTDDEKSGASDMETNNM